MFQTVLSAFLHVTLMGYVLAQTGDFPINDHVPNIPGVEHTNFEIAFDQQGLMYVANRSGLLRYDGRYWERIKTPSSTFSLTISEDDRVYVGCMGSFGFLELTKAGVVYKEVSPDSIGDQFIFSTQVIRDRIVYLSRDVIWSYYPSEDRLESTPSPDDFELVSVVHDSEAIYVNTEIASYTWDSQGFKESDTWIGDEYPPLFLEKQGSDYLALDLTGKLFYRGKSQEKLLQILPGISSINGIKWINDSLLVVSTKDWGAVVANSKRNFEIAGRINYENGLADNEIQAMEVDWSQGIWLAHQFGFSRVDPIAPVHGLSNKEGLEGNLTQSIIYKGELIVGTSSGVYRMVKDSVYSTRITQQKVKVNRPVEQEKGKLIKRLFSGQQENEESGNTYAITQQREQVLEYVRWRYEPLSGVNSKCNRFWIQGDVLLVGTNGGLYEYNGERTAKILNQTIKDIIPIPATNEFLLLNNDFEVDRYLLEEGQYTNLTFGYDETLILEAYCDQKGLVWLVTPGHLRSFGLTYFGASALDEFEFPNQYFEKPTMVEMKDKLYFITTEGYFMYDYDQKVLMEDTVLLETIGEPIHHFNDTRDSFWVFDGKLWKHIHASGEIRTYSYLSLYPDISFINKTREGSIYFINERNQLYRYTASEDHDELYQSHIFYKHLYAQSGYSQYAPEFNLNYDENYLRVEISQPDYLGLLQVEFQYLVEGLDKQWSEWSSDNKIQLNFIPDGSYQLRIRSKDVFDRIQEGQPIDLVVKPPYWRTTWFYMLEVLFFAGLVVVSARLNQGKVRNRFITEGLTILTIVMIIEFLQSVAQSYFDIASSPIFDFLINLSVALIIFPLEIVLKRIIRGRNIQKDLTGTPFDNIKPTD